MGYQRLLEKKKSVDSKDFLNDGICGEERYYQLVSEFLACTEWG